MDWEPSFAPAVPVAPAFVPAAPVPPPVAAFVPPAPAAAPAAWASVRSVPSNITVFLCG
jgi:hypothetical protein